MGGLEDMFGIIAELVLKCPIIEFILQFEGQNPFLFIYKVVEGNSSAQK